MVSTYAIANSLTAANAPPAPKTPAKISPGKFTPKNEFAAATPSNAPERTSRTVLKDDLFIRCSSSWAALFDTVAVECVRHLAVAPFSCRLIVSVVVAFGNGVGGPLPACVAQGHGGIGLCSPVSLPPQNLESESTMKFNAAFLLLAITALSGCVQTAYSKSISVTKDAEGRIVQTVETETVTQPGQGYQMKLEKIKGIQP